jgi:hypothetical protein
MAVAVHADVQEGLDHLTRALLQALTDQADAHRLDRPEARDAARAIAQSLVRQACNMIVDPLVARRLFEMHAAVIDQVLAVIAAEQGDGRQGEVGRDDRGDLVEDPREGRGS